jgi:hypothetical protein
MKAIVRKRQQRRLVESDKRELLFAVRGNVVETKKVDRWMKRNGIAESILYSPMSTTCKRTRTFNAQSNNVDILQPLPLRLIVGQSPHKVPVLREPQTVPPSE